VYYLCIIISTMLLLTLSKKLNQALGPLVLRNALKLRYRLSAGLGSHDDGAGAPAAVVVKDNPLLDAVLGLTWSMRVLSLEIHDDIVNLDEQAGSSSSAINRPKNKKKKSRQQQQQRGGDDDDAAARVGVVERYLRSALLPTETWGDVASWRFHVRLLKWGRSELLWAMHGRTVQTALLAFPSLQKSPQLGGGAGVAGAPAASLLPPSELLRDAFGCRDWSDDKNWSATGDAMKSAVAATLQRQQQQQPAADAASTVVECSDMVRYVDLPPSTNLTEVPLADVFEMAGA